MNKQTQHIIRKYSTICFTRIFRLKLRFYLSVKFTLYIFSVSQPGYLLCKCIYLFGCYTQLCYDRVGYSGQACPYLSNSETKSLKPVFSVNRLYTRNIIGNTFKDYPSLKIKITYSVPFDLLRKLKFLTPLELIQPIVVNSSIDGLLEYSRNRPKIDLVPKETSAQITIEKL